MAIVIHGFLATFPSALFITTPFKFSHLSSVVPCLKHCTSSSISFLNNSTLVIRLSNFHFFCCLLLSAVTTGHLFTAGHLFTGTAVHLSTVTAGHVSTATAGHLS